MIGSPPIYQVDRGYSAVYLILGILGIVHIQGILQNTINLIVKKSYFR